MLVEGRIADAVRGDIDAYYDLGIAYSSGSDGIDVNLVEAHKWFNLAAVGGNRAGQACRAEIAGEMSPREIAEAQRQARAWMKLGMRAAA
jgi:TPR repeat protein